VIQPQDLVLIAGDISWAMKLAEAQKDLEWIDRLPGTKVMIRGNHDYWWGSLAKVRSVLPSSLHVIQYDVFNWQELSITGTRLWDTNEYNFDPYIEFRGSPPKKEIDEKIFLREIERLTLGLRQLDQKAKVRIVMTHYPPISADLQPSIVSRLLEEYNVDYALFGHLHQLKEGLQLFGEKNGIHYILTAADFLGFEPKRIL
jgi:predicted phosphohydrolase